MRCWAINWADTGEVECMRDDHDFGLEDIAQPNGVLLMDINDIATVQKEAQEDYEAMLDEKGGDEWELKEEREGYRMYMFGDDLMMMMICILKTIQ